MFEKLLNQIDDNLTEEERVQRTVRSARDSVWVISNEMEKKAKIDGPLTQEVRGNIQRNVAHLEIVMRDPKVVELGGDLSDLTDAIANGKAALEE